MNIEQLYFLIKICRPWQSDINQNDEQLRVSNHKVCGNVCATCLNGVIS